MGNSAAVEGIDAEGSLSPNNASFNEYHNPQQMIEDIDSDEAMTPVVAHPKPFPPAINIPLLNTSANHDQPHSATLSYFEIAPNAPPTTVIVSNYRAKLLSTLAEGWYTSRGVVSVQEDIPFINSAQSSFPSIISVFPYVMLAMLMAIFSFTSQQLLNPGLDGGDYHLLISFMVTAISSHPVTAKLVSEALIQYYRDVERKTYSFVKTTNMTRTYEQFHSTFRQWHNSLPLGPLRKLQTDDLAMGYGVGLFAQVLSEITLCNNEMADIKGSTSGEDTARFEYLKEYSDYRDTQTLCIIYEATESCNPNILESMFKLSYQRLQRYKPERVAKAVLSSGVVFPNNTPSNLPNSVSSMEEFASVIANLPLWLVCHFNNKAQTQCNQIRESVQEELLCVFQSLAPIQSRTFTDVLVSQTLADSKTQFDRDGDVTMPSTDNNPLNNSTPVIHGNGNPHPYIEKHLQLLAARNQGVNASMHAPTTSTTIGSTGTVATGSTTLVPPPLASTSTKDFPPLIPTSTTSTNTKDSPWHTVNKKGKDKQNTSALPAPDT